GLFFAKFTCSLFQTGCLVLSGPWGSFQIAEDLDVSGVRPYQALLRHEQLGRGGPRGTPEQERLGRDLSEGVHRHEHSRPSQKTRKVPRLSVLLKYQGSCFALMP